MSGRGPVNPEKNNENSATTIKRKNGKWSKKENMFMMDCYFATNPSRLGEWKRMLEQWNSKGLFFITEQWLVGQASNICKWGWLTEIELEETEKLRLIMARDKHYYHI